MRLLSWIAGAVTAAATMKVLASLAVFVATAQALQSGIAIVFVAHVVAFGIAGAFLIVTGQTDKRARLLGLFFLLIAASFANGLLARFAPEPLFLRAQPQSFLPWSLWMFVDQFPRVPTFRRDRRVPLFFLMASMVAGVALFFAGNQFGPLFWSVVFLLSVPAFPFALWKSRRANRQERRRFLIFIMGLAVGFLPIGIEVVLEALSPAYDGFMNGPARRLIAGFIFYPLLLSIPFTTGYSVVVHRVLDVKVILRRAVQYALARVTLTVAAIVPTIAFVVSLIRHRTETIDTLLTTRSVASIGVPILVLATVLSARPWVIDRIERKFFRESLDVRALLAQLAQTMHSGQSLADECADVAAHIKQAFHLAFVDVLLVDRSAGLLASPRALVRALPLTTSLGAALANGPQWADVDFERPDAVLRTLDPEDQQWLADSGAVALVPIRASAGVLLGTLLLGEKMSETPFVRSDQTLLVTVATSVALEIENRHLRQTLVNTARRSGASNASLQRSALVCETCSVVTGSDETHCIRCHNRLVPIELPYILAGKFKLERRLGRGGMGVVYQAFDVTLERRVAIKVLPRVSLPESVRLRREARAMAGFVHPNLALIYGIESWLGSPALVMEYLAGGTLSDRLRTGTPKLVEIMRMTDRLSDALAMIHDAGLLHRDVKPSNIAFTQRGEPKLLDFGLAQLFRGGATTHSRERRPLRLNDWASSDGHTTVANAEFAGTAGYIAPEVIFGELLDPSADLYSLGVVLFQALVGHHPFAEGRTHDDTANYLRLHAPACPEEFVRLVSSLLARDRHARPSSAREVQERVRECVAVAENTYSI